MTTSGVECQDCGSASEAIEWGFVLLARHGWTAQLGNSGQEPTWRCPACSAQARTAEGWDLDSEVTPQSTRRLRVLLVDDQALVLRATALMLREFDVVTARSGAEALECLNAGSHFDVVVSDISMPGMKGNELFEHVCETHRYLATRFLFLSGDIYRAIPLIAQSAAQAGVSTVPLLLEKPVPRDLLVKEINQLGEIRELESGTFALNSQRAPERKSAH